MPSTTASGYTHRWGISPPRSSSSSGAPDRWGNHLYHSERRFVVSVQGRTTRCEEYTISVSPNNIERFWLDPARDYLLRRHQRRSPQRLVCQTDVTYRKHETWGW